MGLDSKIDMSYIKKLHQPSALLFWSDFLLSSAFGWVFFWLTIYSSGFLQVICLFLAAVFIYRGQTFIHEIIHQKSALAGLETAYNFILGYANCYPSYIYQPHRFHHSKSSYGTLADPEYLQGANGSLAKALSPIMASLLLPLVLSLRFCLLPAITPFLSYKWKTWVFQHASTLVMNIRYKRPLSSPEQINEMMREDLWCLTYRIIWVALIWAGLLPFKSLVIWFLLFFMVSLVNMYRTKLSHAYESQGHALSKREQLLDTSTFGPWWWNELLAPVGLSYHAAHHLFPAVPYHNLKKLHFYLLTYDSNYPYEETMIKGLPEIKARLLSEKKSTVPEPKTAPPFLQEEKGAN